MHNIHFIVTSAESPEDACSNVECAIEDWGNENNWRTIIGCISENDHVYISEKDSRFENSLNEFNTINKLNKELHDYISFDPTEILNTVQETITRYNNKEKIHPAQFYMAREAMNKMYQKAHHINSEGNISFNILEDEVYAWTFDEFGVTHIDVIGNNHEDVKKYIVVIDMHS